VITEETMRHLTRVAPNNRDARLALALHKRRAVGKNHAYIIDPGMALAREICRRETEPLPTAGQIMAEVFTAIATVRHSPDVTELVPYSIDLKEDRIPDLYAAVAEILTWGPPDRTMPAVKTTWPAPTVEAVVLDAFDIWAGKQR
jgi:hypothetical protein